VVQSSRYNDGHVQSVHSLMGTLWVLLDFRRDLFAAHHATNYGFLCVCPCCAFSCL